MLLSSNCTSGDLTSMKSLIIIGRHDNFLLVSELTFNLLLASSVSETSCWLNFVDLRYNQVYLFWAACNSFKVWVRFGYQIEHAVPKHVWFKVLKIIQRRVWLR